MLLRNTLLVALATYGTLAGIPALAADGRIDPTFGEDGLALFALDDVEGRELRTNAAAVLPDGRLLFAGARNKFVPTAPFDPHYRATVVRLNADGSPDTGFGGQAGIPGLVVLPDLLPPNQQQVIEDMHLLADGSMIVAGSADAFGALGGFVVKLDADGAMDPAFGTGGMAVFASSYVHALAVDSQGRIVVGGERLVSGQSHSLVARLNADGSPDTGFGDGGSVILGWGGGDEEGSLLSAVAIDGDDRIVAGGSYEAYGAGMGSDFAIARLAADGSLDTGFAGIGWRVFHVPGDLSTLNAVGELLLQPDGEAVFAGHHADADGNLELVLGRLRNDGSDDASFGAPATPGFHAIPLIAGAWNHAPTGLARQSDGKLVVGVSYVAPGIRENYLALRVDANGQLDPDFADGGLFKADLAPDGVYSDLTALALLPDGRPILAGSVMRSAGSPLVDLGVVRLTGGNDRLFANGFD